MRKHTLFIVLIIATALGIGIWRDNQNTPALTANEFTPMLHLSVGTAFPAPREIPAFDLTDMWNKPFTNLALKNRWSFMFFGYTHCPNVCPTILANMHLLSQHLRAGPHVQFIFVTIDPGQDTPARLKAYLLQEKFRSTSFIGVSGNEETIQHLTKGLGVHVGEDKEEDQHIQHGGTILLINPQGKLAAIFTASEKTHAIAHDFKEIVHRFSSNL